MERLGVATLFRQLAYAGDRATPLAILDQKRSRLPHHSQPITMGSWWMLTPVIEDLVILGEQSQARQLYPLARELVDTGTVAFWPSCWFTQTFAGVAATAARLWEAAEDHFNIAMHQTESFPNLLGQAEICRFHSMMLIDRAAPRRSRKSANPTRRALENRDASPRRDDASSPRLGVASALLCLRTALRRWRKVYARDWQCANLLF